MANDPKDENDKENKENTPEEPTPDTSVNTSDAAEASGESDDAQSLNQPDEEEETEAGEGGEAPEDVPTLIEDSSDQSFDAAPERPADAPPPSAPPQPVRTGPSTFAVVFGGLIAGAIGFLVATFAVPEGWPNPPRESDQALSDQLAETSDALAAQSERLDALQAEIASAPGAASGDVDLGPLDESVEALTTEVGGLTGRLDDLTATLDAYGERLTALEERPASASGPDGSAAMEAQLEAFRAELDEVTASARAEIEAAQARASQIEADAAAAAEAARQRAALADLQAALESGAPFSEPLADLPEAPKELTAVADTGVPTLSSLQDEFPAVARSALSNAQVVPEDAGAGERLAAFLRRQTNARSLSPQEGDSADAVLSRAEAALASGDLDAALAELEALPEAAKPVAADWIAAAESRRDAVAAAERLSNAVN